MVLKSFATTGAGLAVALMMAGCAAQYSPTPLASNFPIIKQPKLQAASHWGIITDNIEKQLLIQVAKAPPRPLYISEPLQPSPFQHAMAAQLMTSLVNDGYVVSKNPAGSLRIDIDVQAVTFTADRPQYRYHGQAATLGAGVWALTEVEFPVAVVGAAGGYDAYNWFNAQFAPGATPKTEIIVTASVSDQYRYVARNTSAYYVADTDRILYGINDPVPALPEAPKLTRLFKVRGDM